MKADHACLKNFMILEILISLGKVRIFLLKESINTNTHILGSKKGTC